MQTHAKLLKRVFHFLKNPPRPVEGVWNPLECDKTVFLGSDRGLRPLGAAAVRGTGCSSASDSPPRGRARPGAASAGTESSVAVPDSSGIKEQRIPLNNRAPPLPSPQGQGVLPYFLVFKSR